MTKKRSDGLLLLVFGAVAFVVIGVAWRHISPIEMGDFKVVYYSSRCLLEHGDPYREGDVLRVYGSEGRESATEPALDREVKTRFFYPPTAFIVTLPFAIVGFAAGKIAWTILLAGSLVLAAMAVWDVAADYVPLMGGMLAGLLLMNSFWLFMIGNSAAIAVGFCVLATWCFLRGRFPWAGVLLMALSLALKPNDSGLVWLIFLISGGNLRKRALQSLVVLALLSLPVIIWVTLSSPHFLAELRQNMASFSGVGGIVDPAATGMAARNMDSIVNLQSAVSIFFIQPAAYNLVTYVVCAPLIGLLLVLTVRNHQDLIGMWLAIAVAAPLSMLPTYHFQHDAKVMLLTVPACVMLWVKRDALGWIAVLLTSIGIVICGDIFTGAKILLTRKIVIPGPDVSSRLTTMILTRPAPLVLLAIAMFYLFAFMRHTGPTMIAEPDTYDRAQTPVSDGAFRFTTGRA